MNKKGLLTESNTLNNNNNKHIYKRVYIYIAN